MNIYKRMLELQQEKKMSYKKWLKSKANAMDAIVENELKKGATIVSLDELESLIKK